MDLYYFVCVWYDMNIRDEEGTRCAVLLTSAAKQFTDEDRLRPACSKQCVPFVLRQVRHQVRNLARTVDRRHPHLLKAFDAVLARMPGTGGKMKYVSLNLM